MNSSKITSLLFISILGFFVLNQQFSLIKDTDYNENKSKAEKPELSIFEIEQIPRKFENYYNDNFSLRGHFINKMGWVYRKIWKTPPLPDKVIVGKNSWLFNVDKELDCFYGRRNFSDKELKIIYSELRYRKRILDSMGIKMLVMIHPTKYSIYPEYLPTILSSDATTNTAVQLVNYLEKNDSEIDVLYTKDFLLSLKNKFEAYYKGDNHWTEQTGFHVSNKLIEHLNMGIPSNLITNYCSDTLKNWSGNLAAMMADAKVFSEDKIQYQKCENNAEQHARFIYPTPENPAIKNEYQFGFKSANENLPDALIIRDSFGNALMPYLKNSFHHSTYIWDEWNYSFNLSIIEKEKPDVVIYMILESLLPNLYSKGLSMDWKN